MSLKEYVNWGKKTHPMGWHSLGNESCMMKECRLSTRMHALLILGRMSPVPQTPSSDFPDINYTPELWTKRKETFLPWVAFVRYFIKATGKETHCVTNDFQTQLSEMATASQHIRTWVWLDSVLLCEDLRWDHRQAGVPCLWHPNTRSWKDTPKRLVTI